MRRLTGSRWAGNASAVTVNMLMLASMFTADKELVFASTYFICMPLLGSSSEQARNNANLAVFLTPVVLAAPSPSQIAAEGMQSFAPLFFTAIHAGLAKLGSSTYYLLKWTINTLWNEQQQAEHTPKYGPK